MDKDVKRALIPIIVAALIIIIAVMIGVSRLNDKSYSAYPGQSSSKIQLSSSSSNESHPAFILAE